MPKIASTKTPAKITWTEVYTTLPNLHVLMVNGKEAGMIHKPHDSKSFLSRWKCYLGIGDDAKLLGHGSPERRPKG